MNTTNKIKPYSIKDEEWLIISDLAKDNGLGLTIPTEADGCYLIKVGNHTKGILSSCLTTSKGKTKHFPNNTPEFLKSRFIYEVTIFEKEAIKFIFRKLGITAPSKYYRGKGSFTIRKDKK